MTLLRRLPPLETLLVLLAVVVLGYVGVAQQAAHAPPNVDSYSSFDAASGGYRAWYELLEREGTHVARLQRPTAFLGATDTLVWAEPLPGDPRAAMPTSEDVRALDAWVKAGGHLLYVGYDDVAATQGLLKLPATTGKAHGVRATAHGVRAAAHGIRVTAHGVRAAALGVGVTALGAALRAAGVTRIVWSAAPRRYAAKRGATVLASDAFGALALRYNYGRGQVTAIVDESPFTNSRLALPDNARFAYAIAQPARAGGAVAFNEAIHGFIVPEHWWEIVPRPFLIGVICAAFALLLAFAGASVRLGPPIVPPALRDPTSLEFVDSVAGLLERGRGARQAVIDAVRSTKRMLALAVGVPDDAPNETIAARIDSSELRSAFTALALLERPLDPDDATLLRAATLAQRLRKEYSPHAGSRR